VVLEVEKGVKKSISTKTMLSERNLDYKIIKNKDGQKNKKQY